MTRAHDSQTYNPVSTYIVACEEARQRGDRRVGTDHLLLALLRDPHIEDAVGVNHEQARTALVGLDKEALVAIGLPTTWDVPPLSEHALAPQPSLHKAWKIHMKLSPSAKRALREFGPRMRVHLPTSPEQLLASLLENNPPDPAAVLLNVLGVDSLALRQRLNDKQDA
jgi:hypothetical protein